MNPKDAETLALQYAQRRIAEGEDKVTAVHFAQVVYGLTPTAVARLIKAITKAAG